MRYLFIVSIIFALPSASFAQWSVPGDFPNIQSAISSPLVVGGDSITVMPGTYVENIDFMGKPITLTSDSGAWRTVIDGGMTGSVVTFANGEDSNSVLDGFTLTNGSGTDTFPPNGNFCGGGIYCQGTSPTIINNIIIENTVPTLGCFGGGIYCCEDAFPVIDHSVITGNYSGDDGAGISCWDTSSPTISSNIITHNNSAVDAGGIDCWAGTPLIVNNIIARNTAGINAGGIRCVAASPVITNNTVCNNTAGANAGGIECGNALPRITNTIVWQNSAQNNPEISGITIVRYCDVRGGYAGTGNINANPQFVAQGSGDFHLKATSPCIDAGDNTAWDLPDVDFEDDPRCFDVPSKPDTGNGTAPIADIGADEFYWHLYCNGNPTTPNGFIQGCLTGLPATSPVGLFIGFGVRNQPVHTVYGDFCLLPPWILLVLWPIPSTGVLTLPTTVPSAPPGPYEVPLQALIGNVLTNHYVIQVK